MTIGNSPVAFPCVCTFPSFAIINTESDKVVMSRLDFLPTLPVAHSYPSSEPIVQELCKSCHVRNFELVYPSCYSLKISIPSFLVHCPVHEEDQKYRVRGCSWFTYSEGGCLWA